MAVKNRINRMHTDAYHQINSKYRTLIHCGFKNIYKLCHLFFSLLDEECVPGKINANFQSKIRDANK